MHISIKMKTEKLIKILNKFKKIEREHQECRVEVGVIANEIKLSRRTTLNYLNKLTEYKFLEKISSIEGINSGDFYQLNKEI